MTRESVVNDVLPFEDGTVRADVHAFHDDIGHQYAIQVGPETISLTLTEDGTTRPLPKDPDHVYDMDTLNPLVPAAHTRYVWEEQSDDWKFHSVLIPTIGALRTAKARMEPLGAHSFPLTLRQGDDADGLFKFETMLGAIADGEFIISNQPNLYIHDALYHGLGLTTLDSEAAKTLQATSQLTLRYLSAGQYAGTILAKSVVNGYDFATYFFPKPDKRGCSQLKAVVNDSLFTTILKFARQTPALPHSAWAELVRTVEQGPFTYNVKSQVVRRYPATAEYYRQVKELLASSERAS